MGFLGIPGLRAEIVELKELKKSKMKSLACNLKSALESSSEYFWKENIIEAKRCKKEIWQIENEIRIAKREIERLSGKAGNLKWTFSKGTLTIKGKGEMDGYFVYSPPWTAGSQDEGDAITTVVIEEGVTSIGDSAFAYLRNLTSVTIPESVTSIGAEAFTGCGKLSITIPDSVTYLAREAFASCCETHFHTINSKFEVTVVIYFDDNNCSIQIFGEDKKSTNYIFNTMSKDKDFLKPLEVDERTRGLIYKRFDTDIDNSEIWKTYNELQEKIDKLNEKDKLTKTPTQ